LSFYHPDVDRARAADGDLGQRQDSGARLSAPCLLHPDDPADDRGRQHLALLLHPRLRTYRPDRRPLRTGRAQLARKPRYRSRLSHRRDGVKEAGFFMIFYLAALQQISPVLGEAAAIEGAGRWYFFRRITFPLLMPTTLFV